VSLESARVRNLDAAQYQFQSVGETMDIVTNARADHGLRLVESFNR
jgi:hypothetical protein